MSYRLEPDEAPATGVRRIAREQLGKALDQLEKIRAAKAPAAVHATRKHIKKVRALLRLICDEIGEEIFAEENSRLRDVGRALSGARDAQVQLDVLGKLREQTGQTKTALRKSAVVLKREATAATDLSAEAEAAVTTLQWIGDRIEGWPLDDLDAKSLCCAMKRFYRRGRKALRCAQSHPDAENFHTWRKRVKDVWYQALLLQSLNPTVMSETAEAAKTLGHQLGDLHDFAFFREKLASEQTLHEDERAVLLGLTCVRQSELEAVALDLGARFFAEKPKAFEKRLLRYAGQWPAAS